MTLLALAVLGAAVPVAITVTHWLGWGTYGWHPHIDTLAHFGAGVAIGAATLRLWTSPWLAVGTALTLALAWEWVEPRLSWVSHVGRQDTEADIMTVVLAATLVTLL